MKFFTEPTGKFIIKLPTEWQYKNIDAGHKEVSPFSFELYENSVGAFQVSCYSENEQPTNPTFVKQKYDTNNLKYLKTRMDGGGFNVHLWFAVVEDHTVIAKYIYVTNRSESLEIRRELEKANNALASLEVLSPSQRELALELDKYEKFLAALAASFDLKYKAMENLSLIELLIIIANQIDAYLRMAIVLKKQLDNNTDRIDTTLLFQGPNDKPIMERSIYKLAKDLSLINQNTLDKLEELYGQRNKVVHRYIISEFKTKFFYEIIYAYDTVCEETRLVLKSLEDKQAEQSIGIYKRGRKSKEDLTDKDMDFLFSQVNDKHLTKDFFRKIKM